MYVASMDVYVMSITYIPGFGGTPLLLRRLYRISRGVTRNRARRRFQHGAIEFRLGCSLFLFANSGLKEKRAPETKPVTTSNDNNRNNNRDRTCCSGRRRPIERSALTAKS